MPNDISLEDENYSKDEEDAFVINMSQEFADWVAAFLRRVILLFENLPEEGANGAAGGQTEGTPNPSLLKCSTDESYSQFSRRRVQRVQPNLRAPVRAALRHGAQYDLRLREQQRTRQRCARDSPACGMCCERESAQDSVEIPAVLYSEYPNRVGAWRELCSHNIAQLHDPAFRCEFALE